MEYNSKPFHHLAQLSYITHLLEERSVLVLSEETCLAEFIRNARAQVVQVTEQDPTPATGAAIDCHRLPLKTLNFEDGVFGAAVIPNLAAHRNPEELLRETRRILAPDAHLLVGTPNPEAVGSTTMADDEVGRIDYYRFYDLLISLFPSVQMVGQSPFGGYAVSDLSCDDDEPEVGFNTDLLGDDTESIEWFFSICGATPAVIEPCAIVQAPSVKGDVAMLQDALAEARLELSNRGVRIESLEKKLEEELMQSEEARARAVKIAKELDNERKATTKRQLEEEFSKRSQDIDLQSSLHKSQKELRMAIERANSAEAARDEIIERMRADAQELDRLRKKLDVLEEKHRSSPPSNQSPELQKKLRMAEERARSAEAARDEIIERMRADAQELERLRTRLSTQEKKVESQAAPREADSELKKTLRLAEERARSAEAARDEIIDRMRADAQELERLRKKFDALETEKKGGLDASRELQALEERLKAAEARAASAEAAKDELTSRLERKNTDIALLEDQKKDLNALNEKIEFLTEHEKKLVSEIAELKKEPPLHGEEAPSGAHEDAEAEQKEVETGLKEEISTLQNENAELERRLQTVAKEKTAGQEEAARLESLVRDLVVKLEQMELAQPLTEDERSQQIAIGVQGDNERIDAMEEEIAALWGAKAGEHRARVEAELELTSVMLELKKATDELAELNVILKSRDEELRQVKTARNDLVKKLSAAKSKQAELETNISRVQTDPKLQDQQMRVAELEGELQSVKWRVEELNARNTALEAELDAGLQLEDELRATIEEMEERSDQGLDTSRAAAQQRTLSGCIASINALYATKRGLEQRLDKQTDRLEELQRVSKAQGDALEASKRRERLLDEETESQRNRANRLKSDLDELVLKTAELESELTAAQSKRERMQNETGRLIAEIEEAKQSRRELVAKLEEARQEANDTRTKLEMVNTEMQGAHGQIGDLKAVIEQGESAAAKQLTDALSMLDAERTAHREAQEKLLLTEDQLTDELSRVEGLMAAVTVLKAELENESNLMRLAGADAARASGEVQDLRAKVAANEQRIEEQAREIEVDIRVLADLRKHVSTLTTKINQTKHVEASALEDRQRLLDTAKEETERLTAELATKQDELSAMKVADDALRSKLRESEQELETFQEQLQEMQVKVVTINQSKVDMSAELAESIERAERLDALLKTAKESEANLKAEIEALKTRASSADETAAQAAAKLEEENTRIQATMEDTKKQISDKEALIDSLTEQLEERERRTTKMEQENQALNEQIREHEVDISAWNMELKLRTARISQLEKEIDELRRV